MSRQRIRSHLEDSVRRKRAGLDITALEDALVRKDIKGAVDLAAPSFEVEEPPDDVVEEFETGLEEDAREYEQQLAEGLSRLIDDER